MLKVFNLVKEEDKANALEKAKLIGLDKIDSSKRYSLKKLGAKKTSRHGYPDAGNIICGHPLLVGVEDSVWLAFNEMGGWYKTSPIKSCTETETCFEIETQNSFYILVK
jgi:hypothetical protein